MSRSSALLHHDTGRCSILSVRLHYVFVYAGEGGTQAGGGGEGSGA